VNLRERIRPIVAYLGHVGYAIIITWVYARTLSGPLLLGLQDAGAPLIATGLAGYAGFLGTTAILTALRPRSRRWELVLVSVLGAALAVVTLIMYLLHQSYFGGRTEYSRFDYVVYFASIIILSATMRAFLQPLKRAATLMKPRIKPKGVSGGDKFDTCGG
jgi:hypothetical protein